MTRPPARGARRLTLLALFTAIALTIFMVEAQIPVPIPIPGVKLGLANTVTIFALYRLSFRDACAISLLRVLLVGILFGNAFTI